MLSVLVRAVGSSLIVLLVLASQASADNDLDATFSGDGIQITQFPGEVKSQADDVAIQPDGKIVVAGSVGSPSDFAVARYNADGSLDSSFSGDGLASVAVTADFDAVSGLAIQPDGRIVLAGLVGAGSLGIARLLPDGTLDASFAPGGPGGDGVVALDQPGALTAATDVELTSTGAIVASYTVRSDAVSEAPSNFGIARYTSAGDLDPTFGGGDGLNEFDLGQNDEPRRIEVLPDGSTIIAGISRTTFTDTKFAAAKVDAAGNLDPAFDGDGTLLLDGWDSANAVTARPGGGYLFGAFRTPDAGSTDGAVLGLTAAGALDPGFGSGGVAPLESATNELLVPTSVEVAPDGRIAVSGAPSAGGRPGYGAARLLANGSLDTSYSSDGIASADIGPGFNGPAAGAVQPDARMVVAGGADRAPDLSSSSIAVVRFQPNGGPDEIDPGGGVDEAVEGVSVDAPRRQEQGRRLRVEVEASADEEPVVAAVSGSFKIAGKKGKKAGSSGKRGGKLKVKRFQLDAGESKTVRLRAKKRKDERKAIKAMKKGRRVVAKVKVKITDEAGNTETETAKVKLKRKKK